MRVRAPVRSPVSGGAKSRDADVGRDTHADEQLAAEHLHEFDLGLDGSDQRLPWRSRT
jgi:hypothetical protein